MTLIISCRKTRKMFTGKALCTGCNMASFKSHIFIAKPDQIPSREIGKGFPDICYLIGKLEYKYVNKFPSVAVG